MIPGMRPRIRMLLGSACTLALTFGLSACGNGDNDGDATADTTTFKVATYQPQGLAATDVLDWFTTEVTERSDGRIKFETFYAETLVKAGDILSAVGGGQVDLGYTANIYHASEMPLTTVVELPGVAKNSLAQSKALMDLYASNSDFKSEYSKNGVHLVYPQAIGENIIGSKSPIHSEDALKGLSIRAVGLTAKALALVGANPVELSSPEIYQAVARGTVDAYASTTLDGVSGLDLQEHTKYVTGGWYGAYATGPVVMNEQRYESLPSDLRKIIDEVGLEAIAQNATIQTKADQGACDKLAEAGVIVENIPAEVGAKWQSAFDAKIVDTWVDERNAQGLDGTTFFDEYQQYLDKAEETIDYEPAVTTCAERIGSEGDAG